MEELHIFNKTPKEELKCYNLSNEEKHLINITKKIRNLAKLDRIKLDETVHLSGLNLHLFDYIKYCKGNILDYIKEHLSNIQPFMLSEFNNQIFNNQIICMLDNLYRINIYIKINKTQNEELIISFHENNKNGIAKTNTNTKLKSFDYVYVFADYIISHITNTNKYGIQIFLMRGMLTLPLNLIGEKCDEVYKVMYGEIETPILNYCNEYLRDLYTSNLNIDFDKISIFSALQQLTFTSYGKDTFSTLSILIDSSLIQNDVVGKKLADFTIITFLTNLKLTTSERDNLIYLINERYKVYDYFKIEALKNRIIDTIDNISLIE